MNELNKAINILKRHADDLEEEEEHLESIQRAPTRKRSKEWFQVIKLLSRVEVQSPMNFMCQNNDMVAVSI